MKDLDKTIESLQKLNIAVKNADNSFRTFQEVVLDFNDIFDLLDEEEREKASAAIVDYGFKTLEDIQ